MTPWRARLNGRDVELADVPAEERLLDTVRWRLEARGTKEGCRTGDCGACTMWVGGRSVLSCLVLSRDVEGEEITTIEGFAPTELGQRIQEAFEEAGAVQCGYCTPGFVMALGSLLKEQAGKPLSEEEICRELSGNLCRCTGYFGLLRAARRLFGGEASSPSDPSTFSVAQRGG
jgi:carbon-monoxide dehydrogenase small subunit